MEAVTPSARVRGWQNLRVVDTIYEEEYDEDSSSTSLSPSPPLSSPSSTPLHSRVKAWSLSSGLEPDVVIHVEGSCFHLHKDPLVSTSRYLKRHLIKSSIITLTPPLKLTADTFTLVAGYCYGGHLFITPFNVASLLLAAEVLEMTYDSASNDNLRQKTEAYFCRTVSVNRDYAAVVLRSCIPLLPEAEMAAALLSRCIEALSWKRDVSIDVLSNFHGMKELSPGDFQLVVESLHQRLNGSHDLLYRILDFYLKEHCGKIMEEEKSRICNYIDCTNLSPQVLMHAVQNPRMPLRFVVQAMFIEQLNTRRSVFSTAHNLKAQHRSKEADVNTAVTLGAILQRDAALRQVAQLKATMDSTSSRIESLEQELNTMREILSKSEMANVGKSESFRFSSERKVERGQRGSVSSGSFRSMKMEDERNIGGSFRSMKMEDERNIDIGVPNHALSSTDQGSPRRFGKRLMNGLKSAFRVSGLGSKASSRTREGMIGSEANGGALQPHSF